MSLWLLIYKNIENFKWLDLFRNLRSRIIFFYIFRKGKQCILNRNYVCLKKRPDWIRVLSVNMLRSLWFSADDYQRFAFSNSVSIKDDKPHAMTWSLQLEECLGKHWSHPAEACRSRSRRIKVMTQALRVIGSDSEWKLTRGLIVSPVRLLQQWALYWRQARLVTEIQVTSVYLSLTIPAIILQKRLVWHDENFHIAIA